MPTLLIATLLTLAALLAAGLLVGRVRRRRWVADVVQDGPLRQARTSAVLAVTGTHRLLAYAPDTAHHVSVDVIVTPKRFAVVCDRGLLVDVRVDGARLTSARCTGPDRLVVEGDLPSTMQVPPRYRLDVTLPDAPLWVEPLAPFCVRGHPPEAGDKVAPEASLNPALQPEKRS